jgi:hypothetical protein
MKAIGKAGISYFTSVIDTIKAVWQLIKFKLPGCDDKWRV